MFPFVDQLQIQRQLQGKWIGEMKPPHFRAKMPKESPHLLLPAWQVSSSEALKGNQTYVVTPTEFREKADLLDLTA